MKIREKSLFNILIIAGVIIFISIFAGAVAAPEGKIVTLDNDSQTIIIKVNETFLLKLGEEYDWNITIDDQMVLSRVVNVAVVRGAQGIYIAHKEGRTNLTAIGDPVCRREQPPCGAPSRQFRINVVVENPRRIMGFEVFFTILALMIALIVSKRN